MVSLTVQQKRILLHLLTENSPVPMSELADHLNLTTRQVHYRLKPVASWLSQRNASLVARPRVGVTIKCSPAQRQQLLQELARQSDLHLVLSAGQRRQLLALVLLFADAPLILNNLQYITTASRTTILKDLEPITDWGRLYSLELIRKPNFGVMFDGPEFNRRQAIASVLWGDTPFRDPLISMNYGQGIRFALKDTPTSLPIIRQINRLLDDIPGPTAFEWVAFAETKLGGRFTDEAVLYLALVLAVQYHRLQTRHFVEVKPDTLAWLSTQKEWAVAQGIARLMQEEGLESTVPEAEIGTIAMQLLAGVRDQLWPGDLEIDPALTRLVDMLMDEVARAFSTPGLRYDIPLRDGLVSHIIPAILRQRFGVWAPSRSSEGVVPREWPQEFRIASELARLVTEHTGVPLPDSEVETITLLLRAAFVRERPSHPRRVYIICPSGMATAQLLVARLKTRFPSLEIQGVLSLRELSADRVANAHLLISTVPLESPRRGLPVIQVHPLLTATDIEAITDWLTTAVR
ncbi:MAG: transcription antiterminator [Chloroflexi bacterium]|nr:MAG: transcription antiterminator [Chloroflexota bacterium]